MALVGFEIEELETNEFPHFGDQVNEKDLSGSIAYLKDHSILVALSYTIN